MNPIGKMLIGAIMMVGSVYAVYSSIGTPYDLWNAFIIVLEGVIPPVIFIIGLYIVWLELDEMKIEKELKAEEQKAKAGAKKAKKR